MERGGFRRCRHQHVKRPVNFTHTITQYIYRKCIRKILLAGARMGSMMEFDDILYIKPFCLFRSTPHSSFFFILWFNVWIYLQTEMPTKAPGQGRSSTRSDAEESEIGHSSARRRVHRRGRKVSVCALLPNSRQLPLSEFCSAAGLDNVSQKANNTFPPTGPASFTL